MEVLKMSKITRVKEKIESMNRLKFLLNNMYGLNLKLMKIENMNSNNNLNNNNTSNINETSYMKTNNGSVTMNKNYEAVLSFVMDDDINSTS